MQAFSLREVGQSSLQPSQRKKPSFWTTLFFGRVETITLEQVEPLLLSLKNYWCRNDNTSLFKQLSKLKQPNKNHEYTLEYEL